MEQEKLINYITGNLSSEEAEAVRTWIKSSEDSRKEFYLLKNIYSLTAGNSELPELDADYHYLKRKIFSNKSTTLIYLLKHTLKYAAVVAVTLLAVYFSNKIATQTPGEERAAQFHQITVPLGQISEFTFADGTRVWLNSGTTLRFPETAGNSREIHLEGEAYFDVAKNESKPFIVHTGVHQAKVFGTSFNVRSYDDLEVTLIEGSLGLTSPFQKEMDMLNPGEQFRISATGTNKVIRKVDTHPYEAWKEGKLIFRNKSLGEIADDLERWYNVKISFNDQKIKDIRFSGTILKYKPIDQILEAIKLTSPIRYTIQVHPERSSEIVLYAKK
jgi:ferric-dicitrate binding protein FerR (iron transport regulator)